MSTARNIYFLMYEGISHWLFWTHCPAPSSNSNHNLLSFNHLCPVCRVFGLTVSDSQYVPCVSSHLVITWSVRLCNSVSMLCSFIFLIFYALLHLTDLSSSNFQHLYHFTPFPAIPCFALHLFHLVCVFFFLSKILSNHLFKTLTLIIFFLLSCSMTA